MVWSVRFRSSATRSTWRSGPTGATWRCCARISTRSRAAARRTGGAEAPMTAPLTVSIPHRLGKEEAVRRLKGGMAHMATKLGALITIDQEVWEGDTLTFQMRGFGQSASGTINVFEDSIRIDVMLPWVLAKLGERFLPALKKETALLLEKKP